MLNIANYFNNNSSLTRNINFLRVQQNNNVFSPNFGNTHQLDNDTLELSSKKTKKVTIKDKSGNNIEIDIQRANLDDDILYRTLVEGKRAYAVVSPGNDGNGLYLSHLYNYAKDTHRGVGTELLKCAVEESQNRGYKGKLNVYAANGKYSPFAFYYKNNFIFRKGDRRDAIVQYAVRHNIPVCKLIPEYDSQAMMYLDEKSANKFLEGNRSYKERTFEEVLKKSVNGNDYSANFIQSPYENQYYLLIAKSNEKIINKNQHIPTFVMTLNEKTNENGKKCLEISAINNYWDCELKQNFIIEALSKIEQEKGYEKTDTKKIEKLKFDD